jgi:hypothetical protein
MMHRHADRAGPPTPDALRSGQDLIVRRGGCSGAAPEQRHADRTTPLESRSPPRRRHHRPRQARQTRYAACPASCPEPSAADTIPIARPPSRGFAQSGFNEVAPSSAYKLPCRATSQKPPDSQISLVLIHMWTPPLARLFVGMCDRLLSYVRPVCAAQISLPLALMEIRR